MLINEPLGGGHTSGAGTGGVLDDEPLHVQAIRSSGLDWTLVYPTMLPKGPAKRTYRVGDRLPMKGNPTISRADVADFMYKAAHSPEWIHRDAVITD